MGIDSRSTNGPASRQLIQFRRAGRLVRHPCLCVCTLTIAGICPTRPCRLRSDSHHGVFEYGLRHCRQAIIAKLIAGIGMRKRFGYTRNDGLIMWALALSQLAATLTVTLTVFDAKDHAGNRLIDESTRNCVLVLEIVTSVLGPILT